MRLCLTRKKINKNVINKYSFNSNYMIKITFINVKVYIFVIGSVEDSVIKLGV